MMRKIKMDDRGFTLIELMVVVSIIGILAGVSIPLYVDHQARAKVTAGLAEIATAKAAFEVSLNNGEMIRSPAEVGLPAVTKNCEMITLAFSYIGCVIINAPESVEGSIVMMGRTPSPENRWICGYIPLDGSGAKYAPKTCLVDS